MYGLLTMCGSYRIINSKYSVLTIFDFLSLLLDYFFKTNLVFRINRSIYCFKIN